jgi:hypothetical protein
MSKRLDRNKGAEGGGDGMPPVVLCMAGEGIPNPSAREQFHRSRVRKTCRYCRCYALSAPLPLEPCAIALVMLQPTESVHGSPRARR